MPKDRNFYEETIRRLEPDLSPVDLVASAVSAAISLRRIANAQALTAAATTPIPLPEGFVEDLRREFIMLNGYIDG